MNENELWKAICEQESIELCKQYLSRFPSGLHAKEVRDKLKILEMCNAIDMRFLKKYIQMGIVSPRGLLSAGLDQQKVDRILEWLGINEEQLYQTACQQKSKAAIDDYLKFFPNGPHATKLQAYAHLFFGRHAEEQKARMATEEILRSQPAEPQCEHQYRTPMSAMPARTKPGGSAPPPPGSFQQPSKKNEDNHNGPNRDVECNRSEEMPQTDCREEQLNNADKNASTNIYVQQRKTGSLSKLMRLLKGTPKQTYCNSALFAPAEISKGNDMLVQVYIYMDEETDSIAKDARRTDAEAVQRGYTPLNFPVQKGDMLTVRLDMHGLEIEGDSVQNVVWQGRYTKCCFWVPIPEDYGKMKVAGDVYISRNGLELGRMSFFSTIANRSNFYKPCTVDVRAYKKVFISYSHKDNDTVKVIAEAYKALGTVDFFYDRHTLAPGEFFEKKIYEYIDNCDLFILCWSKNSEKSEWVTKERERAFHGAIVVPARLRLYPININPKTAPPDDLKNFLHFEDYDTLMGMSANTDDHFC